MDAARHRIAKDLFSEASLLPKDQRAEFVQHRCPDDANLRDEVLSLLEHSELPAVPTRVDTPEHGPIVGRYRLRNLLGSGGMGAVYEAMQESPRRVVALKIMRRGVASSTSLRRFEFEAQLLARLRHPGIAQIYEAGTHDDGAGPVPYFAMEYIPRARTLTAWATERRASLPERLELFAQVCDAVQHGHAKGIIHRDLKPSNILVDAAGHPRIIDFGVAKATDSDLAIATLQTDLGQLVGTPGYMSPEQCEADPHDLDVRSDVYSLGVLLFELLCGSSPYNIDHSRLLQTFRAIREDPPKRPGDVDPALKGDLETITLKALEKDRDRRYRSAADLSDDIRRYLNHQPIHARPPTIWYQLTLLAKRRRGLMASAGAFLLLLLGFSVAMSMLYHHARLAEARERIEREQLLEERRIAERSVRFVDRLGAALHTAQQHRLRPHEILAAFAQRANREFAEDPEVHSQVLLSMARLASDRPPLADEAHALRLAAADAFDRMDVTHARHVKRAMDVVRGLRAAREYERAESILRRVLQIAGHDGSQAVMVLHGLADLAADRGQFDHALRLSDEAFAIISGGAARPVPDWMAVLRSRADLLARQNDPGALQVRRMVVDMHRRFVDPESPLLAMALMDLGAALLTSSNPQQALPPLEEAGRILAGAFPIDRWPDRVRAADLLARAREVMSQPNR